MRKAGGGATRSAVGEVEVDLCHAMAGTDGIDRHADLHAEAGREWQDIGHYAGADGALPGDGRAGGQTAAPAYRPTRERERQTEPATHAPREGRHRQVGIA